MIRCLALLFLMSCSLYEPKESPKKPLAVISVIKEERAKVNDKSSFLIKMNKIPEKNPQFFLIPSPKSENINGVGNLSEIPIKVQWQKTKKSFKLTAKIDLARGTLYGIYWQKHGEASIFILHTFYIDRALPEIIDHNLNDEKENTVYENKKIIRLQFAEAIMLSGDVPIEILAERSEDKPPLIIATNLRDYKKTVELKLASDKESNFKEGKGYALIFKNVSNTDGKAAKLEPLKFSAIGASKKLSTIKPLELSISHDGVLVDWHLNNFARVEAFLATDDGLFDCLNKNCPLVLKSKRFKKDKSEPIFANSLKLFGLNHVIPYRMILRAEDDQLDKLFMSADFKTAASSGLLISEIMVRPKVPEGIPESRAEFLEIYNPTEMPISLDGVEISIGSGGEHKRCDLTGGDENIIIPPLGYGLIVGSEFDKSLYSLSDEVLIKKMRQKTICGGFSNSNAKAITLWSFKNHFTDHFFGDPWPKEKGVSIVRSDLSGLFINNKYCYSEREKVSPGQKNTVANGCIF